MAYPFRWAAATHIGAVRANNEDAFVIMAEMGLFMVVDGMGGHAGGEVAAEAVASDLPAIAGEQVQSMRARDSRAVRRWLGRLIAEESRQIHLQGLVRRGCAGMGATLAAALLLDGRAYAANLGDSRAYRLRNGRFVQLSKDHSVVGELVAKGEISPEEARFHRARGLVTQYVGMPEEARPYVRSWALKPDDLFLLCTDGLTDQVGDATVREVLEAHADCQAACDVLVEMANARGGIDNVTVVLVRWAGESEQRR